jgi:hypothetical protein
MRTALFYIVLLVGLVAVACAQGATGAPVPTPEQRYGFLISQSDVIVLATVTSAPYPSLPTVAPDATALPRGGVMTIALKVEKVLKGEMKDATLTVAVTLQPAVKVLPGGSITITGWTPSLTVGQMYVLGLSISANGYHLCGGQMNGIFAGDEAPAVAAMIAAFPVRVTLAPPANPLAIGAPATWTFTVRNTGKTPFELWGASLQAFQPAADFDDGVSFQIVSDDSRSTLDQAPRTVKPGEEAQWQVVLLTNGPSNWRYFDAKVFPLPTMVQGLISVRIQEKPNQYLTVTTRTAWTQVSVVRPDVP